MDLWWRKWLALSHRRRQPFFVGFAGRDERGSIEGENLPGVHLNSFEQSVNSRFEEQDKKLDRVLLLLNTFIPKPE